ncbi:MAG TPA: 50S ribosomal protein L5 [Terriglobales bacterium]|jgi:large subunit ribosomal protein L5|nr:50S ribosomal protein L5 [Terriglobales bacterium]
MADEQKPESHKKDEQPKKPKPPKGEQKARGAAEEKPGPEAPRHAAKERPRLRTRFEKEVATALMKELELKNPMAVPRLNKIVVNMGVGEATQNAKIIDPAVNELGQITGQRPVVTKAKKSIAAFKVREGMPIGAMVTLRGDRMYEFFDRLISIVLPRVRDFKGVSTKSFDGRGNYTLGLHDQLIFPEIDYAKVDKLKGMNVTIVTTARSDDQARQLLKHLGMPFRA